MAKLYGKMQCECGQVYELHLEPKGSPIESQDIPDSTEPEPRSRSYHSDPVMDDFVLHAIERLNKRIEALEVRSRNISTDVILTPAAQINEVAAAIRKIKSIIANLDNMSVSVIKQNPRSTVAWITDACNDTLQSLQPIIDQVSVTKG